jgi:hypothetical protein
MNGRQYRRLERLRRSDARVIAHPWLYAAPLSLLAVVVPVATHAVDGASATKNLVPEIAVAAVALPLLRWYLPWLTRKRTARLAKRCGHAGNRIP